MQKVRVAAVSYFNTMPMLAGLRTAMQDRVELVLGHPSACASSLFAGQVDIALCPVGALVGKKGYKIVSDYVIGTKGEVRTVAVYANRPLRELKRIHLSGESRTSNLLAQILEKHHWKYGLEFCHDDSKIGDEDGQLCIGDACFEMDRRYHFKTDLGETWLAMTGLPMVFACWVTLKELDMKFLAEFNESIGMGVNNIEKLELPENAAATGLKEYLQTNISYHLDKKMREGLAMYLALAENLSELSRHDDPTPSRQSTSSQG